jgi:hypothetical protein
MNNPANLTDAQARNYAIAALRRARVAVRRSTTIGEVCDRELDRLIKRKTRINSSSLVTLSKRYNDYMTSVEACQTPLIDAYTIVALF